MKLNKMALIGSVFGSGVAWPMSMYGWTFDNFLLGIANATVLTVGVLAVMAVGVYVSRLRATDSGS